MNHVVLFSGGVGSYCAAKRVIARHGADNVTLLFSDTLMEDEDLYRFLDEAEAFLGIKITRILDGRTPWQVFFDRRFLGNSLVDPCSEILKRKLSCRWMKDNARNATRYVGIDWTEAHRFERMRDRLAPLRVEAPMCEPPYLLKDQMLEEMRADGIEPPRLYTMGFSHNNCGGFCIKAGHAHFALLLKTMPQRYAYHERMEQKLRDYLGKDVTILSDTISDGATKVKKPLTLKALRERLEKDPEAFDMFDLGGCGCFSGNDENEEASV